MDNSLKLIVTLIAKDLLAEKVRNEPQNKCHYMSPFDSNDDGVHLCQIDCDDYKRKVGPSRMLYRSLGDDLIGFG